MVRIATLLACGWLLTGAAAAGPLMPSGHLAAATAQEGDVVLVKKFGKSRSFGWSQGRRSGWQGASRPPGWSHGRKTGWHGSSMPPGQQRMRFR